MSLFGSTASANATAPTVADGIRVQSSVAGKPVQIVYGSNRISGNLIRAGPSGLEYLRVFLFGASFVRKSKPSLLQALRE